jgi:hypothetical protein
MSFITPKSGFPIVKLALGLVMLVALASAMLILKLRQQRCVQFIVPFESEISLGPGCPVLFSRPASSKRL